MSKNVSKGVVEVLGPVVTVLACVARKMWQFLSGNDLETTDSDHRYQISADYARVGQEHSRLTTKGHRLCCIKTHGVARERLVPLRNASRP